MQTMLASRNKVALGAQRAQSTSTAFARPVMGLKALKPARAGLVSTPGRKQVCVCVCCGGVEGKGCLSLSSAGNCFWRKVSANHQPATGDMQHLNNVMS